MGLLTLLDSYSHRVIIYRHFTTAAPVLDFTAEGSVLFSALSTGLAFTAIGDTAFTVEEADTAFTAELGE